VVGLCGGRQQQLARAAACLRSASTVAIHVAARDLSFGDRLKMGSAHAIFAIVRISFVLPAATAEEQPRPKGR
jgi:hypothetical protein